MDIQDTTASEKRGSKNKKQQTNSSINLIVDGGNNQICVDSRAIAKEFGRQHKNVLQTLDELLADKTISRLESKPSNYIKRGKEYRCFELNEAGFLKAMPFIGGRKSREGQKRLVDEFLRLRKQLDQQAKEREKLTCQIARLSGKDSRAILTDEIQKFIAYAKANGSNSADRYFCIITKAIHNTLVIVDPKATHIRELLTAIQLSQLATLELIAAQVLAEGMEAQLPYKDIYQNLKAALNSQDVGRTQLLEG